MFLPFLNRGLFVDPDAQTFFDAVAATGTALTSDQKDLINPFYTGLKTDGIYTKVDGGNILCLTTAAQCYVDWKVPSRVATVNASPTFTFTSKRQFASSGSTDTANIPDSINTTFIPSTAGGVMTQNSAHLAVYRVSSVVANTRNFAGANGASDLSIIPRSTGDVLSARINSGTSTNYQSGITSSSGFFLVSRTATDTSWSQWDSTQGANSPTSASTGLPNVAIMYLQVTGSSAALATDGIAFGCYGSGLTTAEGLLLNTRVQTLMSGLRSL